MKQPIAIFCFFSLFCSLTAQQIELYGGLNHQNHYEKASQPDQDLRGVVIGFGYSPIILDKFNLRITASLNTYRGRVGWGYRYSSTGLNVKNADLGIGVYPVNALILKHIHFNLGTELKILISDQSNGSQSNSWPGSPDIRTTILGKGGTDMSPAVNLGFIGRIGYEIHITESVSVVPQYSAYLGMTRAFKGDGRRPFRQYLCLGVLHAIQ